MKTKITTTEKLPRNKSCLLIVTIAILLMIFLGGKLFAQQRNFDVLLSAGFDPKMATIGAHPDRPNNKPSLDYELSFGFEWENTRILTQYKSHKEVNFEKWTYIQFDYKRAVLNNVYLYGGLEVSQIKKTHPNASYDQMDNYRDVTINPIIFGANLEVQYKLLDDMFGVAGQFSIYQSEDELKKYKKYRKEVTLTVFIYL